MMSARKERGLSREGLAEKIGTSAPIVGRYERGDMMPSVEIATKIAEALAISLDFLVGKTSTNLKDDTMIQRLEDIENLPSQDKEHILFAIDNMIRGAKLKSL